MNVRDLSYALQSAVKTTALELDCVTSDESSVPLRFNRARTSSAQMFASDFKGALTAVELGVFALICASVPSGVHAIGQRPPEQVALPQLFILDPFRGVAGYLLNNVYFRWLIPSPLVKVRKICVRRPPAASQTRRRQCPKGKLMDFTAPSGYRVTPCNPPITGGARRHGELHAVIDSEADG